MWSSSFKNYEGIWGSRGIAPCILNISTRLKWVVNLTTLAALPPGKDPSTHWIGGWVDARGDAEGFEKKNLLALSGFEPWNDQSVT